MESVCVCDAACESSPTSYLGWHTLLSGGIWLPQVPWAWIPFIWSVITIPISGSTPGLRIHRQENRIRNGEVGIYYLFSAARFVIILQPTVLVAVHHYQKVLNSVVAKILPLDPLTFRITQHECLSILSASLKPLFEPYEELRGNNLNVFFLSFQPQLFGNYSEQTAVKSEQRTRHAYLVFLWIQLIIICFERAYCWWKLIDEMAKMVDLYSGFFFLGRKASMLHGRKYQH